jgi:hypothetical protein
MGRFSCKRTRLTNSNGLILLLNFVRTRSTSLQLAIFALKDVPIRPGVAHRTNPLNER